MQEVKLTDRASAVMLRALVSCCSLTYRWSTSDRLPRMHLSVYIYSQSKGAVCVFGSPELGAGRRRYLPRINIKGQKIVSPKAGWQKREERKETPAPEAV